MRHVHLCPNDKCWMSLRFANELLLHRIMPPAPIKAEANCEFRDDFWDRAIPSPNRIRPVPLLPSLSPEPEEEDVDDPIEQESPEPSFHSEAFFFFRQFSVCKRS